MCVVYSPVCVHVEGRDQFCLYQLVRFFFLLHFIYLVGGGVRGEASATVL